MFRNFQLLQAFALLKTHLKKPCVFKVRYLNKRT